MFDLEKTKIIVKTKRGYEKVTASLIEDLIPGCKTLPNPLNYSGLVLVSTDERDAERLIKENIPEAEKVLPVKVVCKADMDEMISNIDSIIEDVNGRFAVRTRRRGRHGFSSIDVNVALGEVIRDRSGMEVDLDFPEKVVFVEIIKEYAFMGVADGKDFPRKKDRDKVMVRDFLRKLSVIQMPYLGDPKVSREMGIRIGREAQTFEVGELVISPIGKCDARELKEFLEGVFEGISSRYRIQRRVYSHKPRETKVYIQNLYELVRERKGEAMVVFEPEGKPISKVSEDLARMVLKERRTNLLIGSREGIPTGIYRFADLVIDLCPGVTIATDSAISSAIMAVSFAIQENLDRSSKVP
ncbi:MAG: RNA-binding protein [Thermoplasmata archaeon]|nr:MAG: RNA-binding protein [Thermoplasmata archaeon]